MIAHSQRNERRPGGPRTLVVVPTYNEIDNVAEIVRRTIEANRDVEVLVVDDNSPDGTGDLADRIAETTPGVHVLHRAGKEGLGAAYLAAFDWALAQGYDVVVEMDADGSHRPEQLPRLLEALESADLVLGSRWGPGGGVSDWPWSRLVLSRGGNAYVRRALRLPLRDATGGYRAFRATALRALDLDAVASHGYCFQVDLARRAVRAGLHVVEVPIDFAEREHGTSKMTGAIVREALWRVTVWGVQDRLRRSRPAPTTATRLGEAPEAPAVPEPAAR